ncbi:MAG: protein translocase subunit SecF [Acidobacteriaceae bacterium]
MELFHDVKIDWLGKKWYFLGFSLIFSIAGLYSLFFWHHLRLDVDFKGGTVVQVKFAGPPNLDRIRAAANAAGLHSAKIERFGASADNEELITLAEKATDTASLDRSRAQIVEMLAKNYSEAGAQAQGKLDLDNASQGDLLEWLQQNDPEHMGNDQNATIKYTQQAKAIETYRNDHGGLIDSIANLRGVADPAVVQALQQGTYLSGFTVRNVEIVGPEVGAQLRHKALMAVLYSLAGMLIYLWFRFELIYGVAAVVAVFHDTIITIGAFSLADREMSLTVIAAILTLIGYSMNDTIVVFDRIRENLRMTRREPLADLVNRSINQTLSRTVLTSGLTFLTAVSLLIFGGEVLRNFSFALVVGILIGTYSSIAVASPMLVAYQNWRAEKRGKAASLPAARKSKS